MTSVELSYGRPVDIAEIRPLRRSSSGRGCASQTIAEFREQVGEGRRGLRGLALFVRRNIWKTASTVLQPLAASMRSMKSQVLAGQIRYQVLGPMRVFVDGEQSQLGGPQQREVLGLLIVAEGRMVATEQLIDRIWPEDPPRTARKNIQGYVHHLRSQIGDALTTEAGGYSLRSNGDVDAVVFEELIRSGRAASDPVLAVSTLRRALDLWRGTPFGDLGDLESFVAERRRLEELRMLALEAWYDARLRTGVTTELLPELERVVVDHPLRDRFRRQLMLALYRAGRQVEALRVFQDYRAELAEAGLEPPGETSEIEQRIARDDPDLRESSQTRPLRGYRILERLGEGAFSVVFRGVQPSVDREVAIKQIRAELANRPAFIRRFEAEAHIVARLEHPHIVPLIDYWREPGSAYLVMRMLGGGSLETAVLEHRWPIDRVLRMVEQIGAALSVAHRAGVVHRDVKSANILFDEDGNAYLSDFGIALEPAESADPDAALSAGSPAYASPEQLRREQVGPEADVHGFAIAVYESLTGRLPFPDEPSQAALLQRQLHDPIPLVRNTRSDVAPAVDEVLQVATAKRPGDRYSTVADFVDAFKAAVEPVAGLGHQRAMDTVVALQDRNPYKGLRAFDEADSADFAGRERLVDQLLEVLGQHRLVAVVGPSGSGKSSVVRAGLLPALRRGRLDRSDEWFVATIMPGAHPLEELEAALTRLAADQPVGLLDVLRDGERGFGRAVKRVLPESGELLLVVDQLEELFTLCSDESERRLFLDGLVSALAEERSRVRVVLTLRADFYDRPLRYDAIGRLVRDATVAVVPLAADELEHAIIDPAHAVGAEFEPGLVSELVADVSDQPGALPMLQYALTELYERRVSGLLLRDAYRDIGGLAGVVAGRAETLFSEVSAEEQPAIRRVFGRLVNVTDAKAYTRRRALLSELATTPAAAAVVDHFGKARLLSFDTDSATREPTVEVAHEALIVQWPRLQEWLDEDRDDLRIMAHLATSAAEWQRSGRSQSELYRGGRLEAAEEWATANPDGLAAEQHEFLTAGIEQRTAAADADRRTNRRLRRLLTSVAAVAVVALIAGLIAVRQQREASNQAELATQRGQLAEQAREDALQAASEAEAARENALGAAAEAETARENALGTAFEAETARLVARAEGLTGENARVAALLAVAAFGRESSPATLGSLQRVLSGSGPVLGHVRSGIEYLRAAWLDDGRMIGLRADGIDLFDSDGGLLDSVAVEVATFSVSPATPVVRTTFDASADGSTIAIGTATSVLVIEVQGDSLDVLFEASVSAGVRTVSLTPSGDKLVAITPDFEIIGFARSGEELFSTQLRTEANALAVAQTYFTSEIPFAALFQTLPVSIAALALDDEIVLGVSSVVKHLDWSGTEFGSVTPLVLPVPPGGPLYPMIIGELSEHGDELLATQANGFARLPASARGDIVVGAQFEATFDTPRPDVASVVEAESQLVALLTDGTVARFDGETGTRLDDEQLGFGPGRHIVLGPEGRRVLIAHGEGLSLLSLDAENIIATALPRLPVQTFLSISSDGTRVVLSPLAVPGPIDLFAPGSIEPLAQPDMGEAIFAVALQGQDALLIRGEGPAGFGDYVYGLHDLELLGMATVRPGIIPGDASLARGLAAGRRIFPAGIVITGSGTGHQIIELDPPGLPTTSPVTETVFGPEGRRLLVATSQGDAMLYDTADWVEVGNERVQDDDIVMANWSADGTVVVAVSSAGLISVRDGDTFEIIQTMTGNTRASSVADANSFAFSADSRVLLKSFWGTTRLWDVESGQQIGGAFPAVAGATSHTNQGDAIHLVTPTEDSALVWNLDLDQWPQLACRFAGSNLTEAEWEQWGPRDTERYAICGEFGL